MKKYLEKIGLFLYGAIMIIGGFQIMFGGEAGTSSISSSVYEFSGPERLLGLLPMLFGVIVLFSVAGKKRKEEDG